MLQYATNIFTHISYQEWMGFLAVALAVLLGDKLWHLLRRDSMQFPLMYKFPIVYATFILLLTLFAREIGSGGRLAWTPLWSWREVLLHHNLWLLWQILLNILLFAPLGVLMGLNRRWPVKIITLAGFGLSLCIEACQLVFRLGLFEWDDILHNGLGCVLGLSVVRWGMYTVDRTTNRKHGKL